MICTSLTTHLPPPAPYTKDSKRVSSPLTEVLGSKEVESVRRHVCGQTPVLFAGNMSPQWGEENQRKQSRWVFQKKKSQKHLLHI